MESQSMKPGTAAIRPLAIPATIDQKAIVPHCAWWVARAQMSQTTDVPSKPRGNAISIGCSACPATSTFDLMFRDLRQDPGPARAGVANPGEVVSRAARVIGAADRVLQVVD